MACGCSGGASGKSKSQTQTVFAKNVAIRRAQTSQKIVAAKKIAAAKKAVAKKAAVKRAAAKKN